jgi:PadR family transcriptional regulator, regulatory protein PadR
MEQQKNEVLPGTLNLMVLKNPLHTGVTAWVRHCQADQADQRQSAPTQPGDNLSSSVALRVDGWISSKWGVSENNRRAKYYSITRAGKKQLAAEEESWRRAAEKGLKQKCGVGYAPPRNFFSDIRLRLIVNGYCRTPDSSSAVVGGAGEVEPHIERIRGVGGRETRCRRRVARPGAYSQGA